MVISFEINIIESLIQIFLACAITITLHNVYFQPIMTLYFRYFYIILYCFLTKRLNTFFSSNLALYSVLYGVIIYGLIISCNILVSSLVKSVKLCQQICNFINKGWKLPSEFKPLLFIVIPF